MNIQERLAVLESQIKGLQRTNYILILVILASAGIDVAPVIFT